MAVPTWNNILHILRVSVLGEDDGQAVNNVFHFKLIQGGDVLTPVPLVDVAGLLQTKLTTQLLPNCPESYKINALNLVLITGRVANPVPPPTPTPPSYTPNILQFGEQYIKTLSSGNIGLRAGDPLPTFVAYGSRWITAVRAKGYRGSSRFRAGVEADTTENAWVDGFGSVVAGMVTFLDSWINPLGTGGTWGTDSVALSVFAQRTFLKATGGFLTPGPFTEPVTSYVANPNTTSQVSRKKRTRLG